MITSQDVQQCDNHYQYQQTNINSVDKEVSYPSHKYITPFEKDHNFNNFRNHQSIPDVNIKKTNANYLQNDNNFKNNINKKISQLYVPVESYNQNLNNNQSNYGLLTGKHYLTSSLTKDKKYISELHINIKETTKESDTDDNCQDSPINFSTNNGFCEATNCNDNEIHCSSFEAYVGNKNDNYEYAVRTPSKSSSNELRQLHKEYHSEKYIYLGNDNCVNLTEYTISPGINKFAERPEDDCSSPDKKSSKLNLSSRSDIRDSKDYSTKSVQTSKKIDCLLKEHKDKSIETDDCQFLKGKGKLPKKVGCNSDNSLSAEKEKKNKPAKGSQHKKKLFNSSQLPNQQTPVNNVSELNSNIQKSVINSRQHSIFNHGVSCKVSDGNTNSEDVNQDTYAESYSDSFSTSIEHINIPVREKEVLVENRGTYVAHQPTVKQCKPHKDVITSNRSMNDIKVPIKSRFNSGYFDKREIETKQNKNSKCDDKNSFEIQYLLDNLNTHLQNTVRGHGKALKSNSKSKHDYRTVGSFWDDPLNSENKSLFFNRAKGLDSKNISQRSVNPEIQAIFNTLDKNQSHHQERAEKNRPLCPTYGKQDSSHKNNVNQMQSGKMMGDSYSMKLTDFYASTENLCDTRFPSYLKHQQCFELSPYDELVKSHLNSSDRRIKSVAAKNGCRIALDGPISVVDPSSTCQAVRSKIAYKCIVAGQTKDKLDKCLNYLKETFPNTCIRLNTKNGMNGK